jgi:biotin synthase
LGSAELTLKVLALTRIVLPRVNLPATTAVATIDRHNGQLNALNCGSNVIMCNFTPQNFRKNYRIYDGKEFISLDKALQAIRKAKRKAA